MNKLKKLISLLLVSSFINACASAPKVSHVSLDTFQPQSETNYQVYFSRDHKPYLLSGSGKELLLEEKYIVFPWLQQRVAFQEVEHIEGVKRVGDHALIGTIVGLVGGSLLGGLAAQASCSDCNFFHGFNVKNTLIGFGAGAGAGGLIGGLVGYAIPKNEKTIVTPTIP